MKQKTIATTAAAALAVAAFVVVALVVVSNSMNHQNRKKVRHFTYQSSLSNSPSQHDKFIKVLIEEYKLYFLMPEKNPTGSLASAPLSNGKMIQCCMTVGIVGLQP
jgi:hypothetical protein